MREAPSCENWRAYRNLLSNHPPSLENVSVLSKENKKFLLELKESLPIMRNKPSLSRNIRSQPLYTVRQSIGLLHFCGA